MGDTDRENTETDPINPEDESADPSSTNLALAYHYLGGSIRDQRAAASFVCGGTFPVVSSPVRVFWAKQDNVHEANQLALPLDSTSKKDSSIEMLDQLVADCEPASFGRGQEDVIDVDYRKAGKLDPDRFVSNFCPADFGIINIVEQILLPNFNTQLENLLPFRRLKAELYKLNVGGSCIYRHSDVLISFGFRSILAHLGFSRSTSTHPALELRLARLSSAFHRHSQVES